MRKQKWTYFDEDDYKADDYVDCNQSSIATSRCNLLGIFCHLFINRDEL